jgi:hypothetical protein
MWWPGTESISTVVLKTRNLLIPQDVKTARNAENGGLGTYLVQDISVWIRISVKQAACRSWASFALSICETLGFLCDTEAADLEARRAGYV